MNPGPKGRCRYCGKELGYTDYYVDSGVWEDGGAYLACADKGNCERRIALRRPRAPARRSWWYWLLDSTA